MERALSPPAVDQGQGPRVEFQQSDQLRRRAAQYPSRWLRFGIQVSQQIQYLGQQGGKVVVGGTYL